MPRLLRILAGFLLCAPLVAACVAFRPIEQPNLSIVNLDVAEATVLEQRYLIRVRVQNPNDFDLAVTGIKYDLKLNGQPFLNGVSGQSFVVPRYGEAITEVTGVSTLFSFVRQIEELQQNKTNALSYELTGKMSLSDRFGRLPFSYRGELSLPQVSPPPVPAPPEQSHRS